MVSHIKTDRGILKYILLTLITCGIYGLWFIYDLAKDVNIMCEGDGKKTAGLLKMFLLTLVTCGIYGIYWWISIADRMYLNGSRYNVPVPNKGSSVLLWMLLGLFCFAPLLYVAMYQVIENANTLAAAYNERGFGL